MRRIATLVIAAVVVLLVAAQLVLPPIAEHRAESRLTSGGGSADVQLHAFPALRLLFHHGSSARVRARGIEVPITPSSGGKVLGQLDGFGHVDVQVTQAHAGPFALAQLSLQRDGDAPYAVTVKGSVTARDLASFVAGPLGGIAGGALPFGDRPVPIDLTATVESDGGRAHATAVSGSVAGVPAGALAELFAQALAGRF